MGMRESGRRIAASSACALLAIACSSPEPEPRALVQPGEVVTGSTEAFAGSASSASATSPMAEASSPSVPSDPDRTEASSGLPDASTDPRNAPPTGKGSALLVDVRAGAGDGYERIVFEFEGTAVPGYSVRWVDGPIQAAGSGMSVDVGGEAFLEVAMTSASGVDPHSGEPTYGGASRLDLAAQTQLLVELVRSGDFEGNLTWVAGGRARSPFRVLVLTEPTRLVIDVQH